MKEKELTEFDDDTIDTFKESMRLVGVDMSKMDRDKVNKMFDNFAVYEKVVNILENKRDIIDGYIKYAKTMLMLRNFGDGRFTVMINGKKWKVFVCDYKKGDRHRLVLFKKIRDDGLIDYKVFEMVEEEFWKRVV